MNMTANELRSRNLRTVLALAALFFLPVAVSFWMYYGTSWRPAGSSIHGELIDPARPLPAVSFPGDGITPATENVFAEQWSLVYVGGGECDEACRRALLVMRQTRIALNQDMKRVRRLFIAAEPCCDREFLDREHRGIVVLDAAAPPVQEALKRFPEAERAHMLFVVDPLGNLMMRYDARRNPKGLLEDLKRLLKLSHIG